MAAARPTKNKELRTAAQQLPYFNFNSSLQLPPQAATLPYSRDRQTHHSSYHHPPLLRFSIATMSSLPHTIKGLTIATLAPILLVSVTAQTLEAKSPPQAKSPVANIDYASFLGQHDMIWDQTPHRWEVSPYSGNGNIGFLFYQHKSDPANAISLHLGRHDYYDHRLPVDGDDHLWIYRGRLPLGRFQISAQGKITSTNLRLNLYKAELTGTITTDQGEYAIHALSHSTQDAVYFKTTASKGESISIQWLPEAPISSSRATLDAGGGPPSWKTLREAPYPLPPKPTWGVTGRGLAGQGSSNRFITASRFSTNTAVKPPPAGASAETQLLSKLDSPPCTTHSRRKTASKLAPTASKKRNRTSSPTPSPSHYQWWRTTTPQSFITLNDAEKEAFYWIQMYKLGSAMRENGPILDLMGPWYHYTFWPMVWGDLNVQLQYWTHLTSNRLSLGASLPNNIDKYARQPAQEHPRALAGQRRRQHLLPPRHAR